MNIKNYLSVLFISFSLVACGGGTGNGDVGNASPVINSLSATPNSTDTSMAVSISWDVTDADGDTLSCSVDADGDGTDDYTVNDCANNTTQPHTFPFAGTYNAQLTVSDGNGLSAQQSVSIIITSVGGGNASPVINSLSATPNSTDTSTAVSISWAVTDADGDTLSCSVDADGNGTADYTINDCANNTTQLHTFPVAGTYNAQLTVSDGNGLPIQQSVSIIIIMPPVNFQIVIGDTQARLSWDSVVGATSYNLYMATETGVRPDIYSVLAGGMAHLSVTSPFVHTGLTNDTTYYFVITAVNGGVESSASIEVSGTPAAPVDISALINDSQRDKVLLAGIDNFNLYENISMTLKTPSIAENGAVVPFTVSFDSFDPGPGAFWVIVPLNPDAVVARFLIEPNVVPVIGSRTKMRESGDVIVVYLADNGSTIYTTKQYVRVTVGGI